MAEEIRPGSLGRFHARKLPRLPQDEPTVIMAIGSIGPGGRKGDGRKGDTGNSPDSLHNIEALLTSISLARFIRDLPMPRASRAAAGGFCYHVLNRGNAGMVQLQHLRR